MVILPKLTLKYTLFNLCEFDILVFRSEEIFTLSNSPCKTKQVYFENELGANQGGHATACFFGLRAQLPEQPLRVFSPSLIDPFDRIGLLSSKLESTWHEHFFCPVFEGITMCLFWELNLYNTWCLSVNQADSLARGQELCNWFRSRLSYTPARKYSYSMYVFELISWTITVQLHINIFLELISRSLHYTYSFVIQRTNGKIVWEYFLELFGIISWTISFQLHERMFLELISQSSPVGVYVRATFSLLWVDPLETLWSYILLLWFLGWFQAL